MRNPTETDARNSPSVESRPRETETLSGSGDGSLTTGTCRSAGGSSEVTRNGPARSRKPPGRAGIKVATLNMRGYGVADIDSTGNSKWRKLQSLLKSDKIGILALQETHLSEERVQDLLRVYSKRIAIYTADSETDRRGVAFVVNKELVRTETVRFESLILGRAALLEIEWREGETLNLLNVYVPNVNVPAENAHFWSTLQDVIVRERCPKIDLMLGNFNMTEDTIDRMPTRRDPVEPCQGLARFKAKFNLSDGWRETHPNEKAYTFVQTGTGSRARLDRIYIAEAIKDWALDWGHSINTVNSDHNLATVILSSPLMPYIGKGRWTMPPNMTKVKAFMSEINRILIACQDGMEGVTRRTPERNPQTLWRDAKVEIRTLTQKWQKATAPKRKARIAKLEAELKRILNDDSLTEEAKSDEAALVEMRLMGLETRRHELELLATSANFVANDECITRYYSNIGKECKPRQPIVCMQVPGTSPAEYTRETKKMSEIARDYHCKQQAKPEVDLQAKEWATALVLSKVKARLSDAERVVLNGLITRDEVESALKRTQNLKSTGLDGIPYKMYKAHNAKSKGG